MQSASPDPDRDYFPVRTENNEFFEKEKKKIKINKLMALKTNRETKDKNNALKGELRTKSRG